MPTPQEEMERLVELDAQHIDAAAKFDAAWTALQEAIPLEESAFKERHDAYASVLRSGFIIEQVIDPLAIKYAAGYTNEHYDGYPYEEPVYEHLDEAHAELLVGQYAFHTGSIVDTPLFMERIPYSGPHVQIYESARQFDSNISVRFEVAGDNRNAVPGKGADSDDYDDPNHYWTYDEGSLAETSYRGLIQAIQWRLPTEEEIAHFAHTRAVAPA